MRFDHKCCVGFVVFFRTQEDLIQLLVFVDASGEDSGHAFDQMSGPSVAAAWKSSQSHVRSLPWTHECGLVAFAFVVSRAGPGHSAKEHT